MELETLDSTRKCVIVKISDDYLVQITEWSNKDGWDITFDSNRESRNIEFSRLEYDVLRAVLEQKFPAPKVQEEESEEEKIKNYLNNQ